MAWPSITEVTQRFQVSVLHYTTFPVVGINSALLEEGRSQAVLWSLKANPARVVLVSHRQEHRDQRLVSQRYQVTARRKHLWAGMLRRRFNTKVLSTNTHFIWGIKHSLLGGITASPNKNRNGNYHFNKLYTCAGSYHSLCLSLCFTIHRADSQPDGICSGVPQSALSFLENTEIVLDWKWGVGAPTRY